MKCVNENCNKDPDKSLDRVVVNIDGDFACSKECEKEYIKQKEEFFNNISDDNYFNNWMNKSVNI
jgi:hypothetical protein